MNDRISPPSRITTEQAATLKANQSRRLSATMSAYADELSCSIEGQAIADLHAPMRFGRTTINGKFFEIIVQPVATPTSHPNDSLEDSDISTF